MIHLFHNCALLTGKDAAGGCACTRKPKSQSTGHKWNEFSLTQIVNWFRDTYRSSIWSIIKCLHIYQSSDAHVEYTSCQIVRSMLHGLMLILTSPTSIFALILSGTCISSLSNRYIGAFTNRKEFSSEIIRAGEKCGERVWTFPLDEDFEEDLKSDIADILQVRAVLATVHSKHQQLIWLPTFFFSVKWAQKQITSTRHFSWSDSWTQQFHGCIWILGHPTGENVHHRFLQLSFFGTVIILDRRTNGQSSIFLSSKSSAIIFNSLSVSPYFSHFNYSAHS